MLQTCNKLANCIIIASNCIICAFDDEIDSTKNAKQNRRKRTKMQILLHLRYYLNRLKALEILSLRLNGIQEVSGSIPLISTKRNDRKSLIIQGFAVFLCPLQNYQKYSKKQKKLFLLLPRLLPEQAVKLIKENGQKF